MARILPLKSEVEVSRDAPRVIDLEGEESEAVFSALASDTSRSIYRALYEEPATASEIADMIDTSVQNVRYHLEKLEKAGLIDEVDIWYSSRGNEMTVYAASDEALIVAGDKHRSSELRSLFKTSAGALGILLAISFVINALMVEFFTETLRPGSPSRGGYIQVGEADPSVYDVIALDPGLLVFLGGFIMITMFTAYSAIKMRRS